MPKSEINNFSNIQHDLNNKLNEPNQTDPTKTKDPYSINQNQKPFENQTKIIKNSNEKTNLIKNK